MFLPDHGKLNTDFGFIDNASTVDLSIIIATYNAEKYIKDCLDSILNQSTKFKIEVIIVNDGSTDETKKIISGYLSDPRIIYYEQANAGQSAARNFAIKHSKGTYIMIVDSDDILCDGSIDCLMNLAIKTKSDIVEGNIIKFYNSFELPFQRKTKSKTFRGTSKNKYILRSFGYSCAKVYRRELWANVRYPEGYIFEDVISKFVLRRLANQVTVTNQFVYAYRWNQSSTSHGNNQKKKLDSVLVFPKIVNICEQNQIQKDRILYLLSLNHLGLLNYITTNFLNEKNRKLCFFKIREQLIAIKPAKKVSLPIWFWFLERAIINGNYDAWVLIAKSIQKYKLLKKYREIN